jgi:cytochrome c oxidase assembly factor CtaG
MIAWPMLVSIGTGAVMVLAAAVLFYFIRTRRPESGAIPFHRTFAYLLGAAFLLHGVWGVIAVFVLKS